MSDNREVFQDAAGLWRWRIVAGNGRTIATSGESFSSKAHAQRALHRVVEGHPTESDPIDGESEQP